MDLNMKVEMIVPVAWMIMEGAMKVGGLHITPSMRAGGAAVKYLNQSKNAYRGNPIVERVIDSIQSRKIERKDRVDLEKLDIGDVLKKVDDIYPILEEEREQGTQAKSFLLGLARIMVNASGSGFMGSGQRVNEDESKYLADLKAHLRL
jgi:hypothetical protein